VPDETRLYHVTVKIDGYVEQLFTATTGQYVKKGDPLLAIYSPMLVTAQQEYLNVLRADPGLAAAARKRLLLWDVSEAQLANLERTGQPAHTLTVYAPTNGWIIERDIATGHRVTAGEQLLVLGDLTSLWADADIHQPDLPLVALGAPVEFATSALPDQTLTGAVSFIAPVLDPETRTVRVRMTLPNADLRLKPEMYGVARLSHTLGERVAVPDAAVMRNGDRDYVFRDEDERGLVPVAVRLGWHVDGWFEVLAGLAPGDRVVTSANFLVDSESSIRAALRAAAKAQP
jgi:Cu(I)/Ag(I) efflux system membrane fusion protein